MRFLEVARGGLQPGSDAFDALREWGEVPREQGKQGAADGLRRVRPTPPRPSLLQLEQVQSGLVDHQVAVERPIGAELRGVEGLHRRDGGAGEGDVSLHAVPPTGRQPVVVTVDTEIGRPFGLELESIVEPALDHLVEASVLGSARVFRRGDRRHRLLPGWSAGQVPSDRARKPSTQVRYSSGQTSSMRL
jgi:hypothetical protein